METQVIEDENGELSLGIPFEVLKNIGWVEGIELILKKGKKSLIITL